MYPPIPDLPADLAELLKLGRILGQHESFALVAGRCSGAQAEALLRIREGRIYLRCAPSWKEFCPKYLHISASQADRIIRMWQLHGPSIFELKQLIRISSEDYLAVEPFLKNNALHFNDEAIEIDPQNAEKIAGAVDEIRRTMPPKEKPASTPVRGATILDRLASLEEQWIAMVSEFQSIAGMNIKGEERLRLELTLDNAATALEQIEMDPGLCPSDSNA